MISYSGMEVLPYFFCCSNLCLSDECAPHHAVREHGGSESGLLYDRKRVLLSKLHRFSCGCNPDFISYLIEREKNYSRSLVTSVMQSHKGKIVYSDFWKYTCSMKAFLSSLLVQTILGWAKISL